MKVDASNIIPLTAARGKLGDLTRKARGENYIILTKDGNPQAALVDIDYLTKLENEVKNLYRKTFIDPKLSQYTRDFTDEEIRTWKEDDSL